MNISNQTYDILKWIAQFLLPAAATLYFALANIWGLPYGEQIVGTITAVDAFLGVILGISSASYNKEYDKSGAVITGTCTYDVDSTDATVAVAEILEGKTAYARGVKLAGTMPNNGDAGGTIDNKAQEFAIAQGYHDGSGKVSISVTEQSKLVPSNIKQGVVVLGVEGTLGPSSEITAHAKSITPGTSEQVVLPGDGYDYLSQVTVAGISYVESDNTAGGKTVTIAGGD